MNCVSRWSFTKNYWLKFSMLSSASTALSIIIRGWLGDFFSHDATAASGPGSPHCCDFMITLIHTTVGRTPLDG
jgi:hypothetical protein